MLVEALQNYVKSWVSDIDLSEADFQLQPFPREAQTSKWWTLKMGGVPRAAATRVGKLLSSLQDKDGKWKQTAVHSGGSSVRLFISPDKSPKQVTTEIHTKLARKALEAAYPKLAWRAQPRDGVITIDQVPLVKIVADKRKVSHPEFNMDALRQLGVDYEAARTEIIEATADAGGASRAAVARWSL